jgi:predicted DNA-binding transcriptional regulator YafY
MTVRMRFSPQMASVGQDNFPSWDKLEEQPDGSVIVTFLTPDAIWATSTALAYDPGVTVLEPEEVRQSVRTWAQAILGQYSWSKGD